MRRVRSCNHARRHAGRRPSPESGWPRLSARNRGKREMVDIFLGSVETSEAARPLFTAQSGTRARWTKEAFPPHRWSHKPQLGHPIAETGLDCTRRCGQLLRTAKALD